MKVDSRICLRTTLDYKICSPSRSNTASSLRYLIDEGSSFMAVKSKSKNFSDFMFSTIYGNFSGLEHPDSFKYTMDFNVR